MVLKCQVPVSLLYKIIECGKGIWGEYDVLFKAKKQFVWVLIIKHTLNGLDTLFIMGPKYYVIQYFSKTSRQYTKWRPVFDNDTVDLQVGARHGNVMLQMIALIMPDICDKVRGIWLYGKDLEQYYVCRDRFDGHTSVAFQKKIEILCWFIYGKLIQ